MPLFFSTETASTEIYTLSLHDALPIFNGDQRDRWPVAAPALGSGAPITTSWRLPLIPSMMVTVRRAAASAESRMEPVGSVAAGDPLGDPVGGTCTWIGNGAGAAAVCLPRKSPIEATYQTAPLA